MEEVGKVIPICCWRMISKSMQAKVLEDGESAFDGRDGYAGGDVECGCGRKWRLAWIEVKGD